MFKQKVCRCKMCRCKIWRGEMCRWKMVQNLKVKMWKCVQWKSLSTPCLSETFAQMLSGMNRRLDLTQYCSMHVQSRESGIYRGTNLLECPGAICQANPPWEYHTRTKVPLGWESPWPVRPWSPRLGGSDRIMASFLKASLDCRSLLGHHSRASFQKQDHLRKLR